MDLFETPSDTQVPFRQALIGSESPMPGTGPVADHWADTESARIRAWQVHTADRIRLLVCEIRELLLQAAESKLRAVGSILTQRAALRISIEEHDARLDDADVVHRVLCVAERSKLLDLLRSKEIRPYSDERHFRWSQLVGSGSDELSAERFEPPPPYSSGPTGADGLDVNGGAMCSHGDELDWGGEDEDEHESEDEDEDESEDEEFSETPPPSLRVPPSISHTVAVTRNRLVDCRDRLPSHKPLAALVRCSQQTLPLGSQRVPSEPHFVSPVFAHPSIRLPCSLGFGNPWLFLAQIVVAS